MSATEGRRELLAQLVLLAISSLACVHLMALPPFEDEGTQLRLIQRTLQNGEWWQPLAYGKPLEAWPMVLVAWIGSAPLPAVRVVHVLLGAVNVLLLYRLARRLADRVTALTAAALFAACPFEVYLERLALSEVMLSAASLWVLLKVLDFIEQPSKANAHGLSVALLLSAACKLPVGFICLTYLPLALLFLPRKPRRTLMDTTRWRLLWPLLPATLAAVAIAGFSWLRLAHQQSLPFGVQDLLTVASDADIAAAMGVARPALWIELSTQLSRGALVILLLGLAAAAARGGWRERWLLSVGLLPMALMALAASFWYSRYLLFMLAPLFVASALGWRAVLAMLGRQGGCLAVALALLMLGLMLPQSSRLVWQPIQARWSPIDRFQYFEGWGSGYGYEPAAAFIARLPEPPAVIYTLDGHSAEQLLTYLPRAWRSRLRYLSLEVPGGEGQRLKAMTQNGGAWLLISPQLLPHYLPAVFGADAARLNYRQLAAFDKPGGRTQLALYHVGR